MFNGQLIKFSVASIFIDDCADAVHLSVHNLSDKFFVVNVALWVLLINEQLFNLIVGQLFAQSGQQMSQLGCGNESAGIFIEMTKSFNEVVGRVARSCFRNRMVDGKEDFERNTFVRFQLVCALFDILFSGILTQGTKAFTNLNIILEEKKIGNVLDAMGTRRRFEWIAYLIQLNFAITSVVEKIERLLEFWRKVEEKN